MSTSATVKGSLLFVVPVAFLIAETTVAFAHIQLDEPTRRQTDVVGPSLQQKRGPCGTNARSSNVSVFEPGATITVRWSETIEHPGHFRIAFDADGQDDFRDPICLTNCENLSNPTFEFNSDETILVDNITDATNGTYSVPVTLPNIECSNCTLQLIQVMYDKPPYTTDARSNDMYYQCADLILRSAVPADAGTPTPDAAPVPDTGPPVVPDAGKRDVGLPRDGGRGPLDAGTIDGPPPLRSDEGLTGVFSCQTTVGATPSVVLWGVVFCLMWRRRHGQNSDNSGGLRSVCGRPVVDAIWKPGDESVSRGRGSGGGVR